ncbi:MAG: LTA synthase family protein [Myxococcota bacterium]
MSMLPTMSTLLAERSVRALLVGAPLALAAAAAGLLRLGERWPVWAWLAIESALVAACFAIALGFQYLLMALVPLEPWAPFAATVPHAAALIAVPVALMPGRWRGRGLGVYLLLFVALSFGDLIYLRYFGNVLPVLAFRSGTQIWDVRDIVFDYTRRVDAWLLPTLAAGALLTWRWPLRAPSRGVWRGVELGLFSVALALCALAALPVHTIVTNWLASERSYRVLNGTDAVQDNGYVVAHAKEISRALRSLHEYERLSPDALSRVKRFHEIRAANETQSADFGIARGTNLLIVQVEGMQEWVIGARYQGQELTPFLNRLRERSLYFERMFDETGDSSTSDAEYMLFNSQLPLNMGSVAFRRADNHFVTLLHVFKEASYTTFAGHAYAAGMWNRAVLYPKYGFDRAAFEPEFGDGPKLGWGIGDKLFVERAVPMLRALPQPFVGFLITLTSHGPFQYVPHSERKLRLGAIESTDFGGYLHSMRYEDEAVELLFQKLDAAKLLTNTSVVIYGDHDSRLRFPAFQADGVELPKGTLLRIAERDFTTKRIPLFVVLPADRGRPAGSVRTLGGLVDVGPTLLHLYGLPRPRSFIGQSLLPERAGHALRVDGSAVNDTHIYVAANGGRCESFPYFEARAFVECDALARSAHEELEISWSVTLSDSASELSGKRPAKSRAER